MLIPWVFILYQNKKKQGRSLLKLCKLRSQSEIHDMSIRMYLSVVSYECTEYGIAKTRPIENNRANAISQSHSFRIYLHFILTIYLG